MSYPYPTNNEDENLDAGGKQAGQGHGSPDSPYSSSYQPPTAPQPPQTSADPYKFNSAPEPYPYTGGQSNGNSYPQQPTNAYPTTHPAANANPYSYSQQGQNSSTGGFSIFGLTWTKNVVPNPAADGRHLGKSTVVAYLLWFFFGVLGVHQYYLGNHNRGFFNLALWGASIITGMLGFPLGIAVFVYWVYEGITLSEQLREIESGHIRKSIL